MSSARLAMSAFLVTATFVPIQSHAQLAIPSSTDAFVASVNAIISSSKAAIDLGRSSVRLNRIKSKFTSSFIDSAATNTIILSGLDEVEVLCSPRSGITALAARRNYLQAVSAKIEEVGKPAQIDNIFFAVKSLFDSQSVDLAGKIPDEDALKKFAKQQQERCENDFKNYAEVSYGLNPSPAAAAEPASMPSLSFIGPWGSLIDAIVAVITPVVVEGAKIIDEQKRRAAVKQFLSDVQNREAITAAGKASTQEISRYVLGKRRSSLGLFSEKLALLRSNVLKLSEIPDCKKFVSAENKRELRQSGAPNDEFTICWRTAWTTIEPQVSATLKAADEYDQIADAGDSDNPSREFTRLANSLDKVADDSVSQEEIWKLAVRLVGFADKVATAASQESRDKIHKAIDNLVKE